MMEELFKIEQYAEMVLHYLRLDSMSSDMLIQPQDLHTLVKQTLRKYSVLFINSGLSLQLEDFQVSVLSDEKWLSFVLEQIISNSIKYTRKGTISIYMDPDSQKTLVIEDTGMGIRQEDIPRIFDRGFTGYNGRMDKKSTGIGLYLCRQIMNRLSHGIWAESEEGKGTRIYLDLSRDSYVENAD
jgi:signal transduction histidine kinase